MTSGLWVGGDAPASERLTGLLSGPLQQCTLDELRDPARREHRFQPPPNLLFISAEHGDAALELASWAVQRHGIPVLLVGDVDVSMALPAMRAGIADVVPPDADEATLTDILRHVEQRMPTVAAPPQAGPTSGRIVTVASPKGGVGKTMIATNLGVGLHGLGADETVLVDLDIHFGDVASGLDLSPEYTLPDAVRAAAGGDALSVKPYLTRHESGLYVVAGADTPAAADGITAAEARALVELLAQSFRFVVIDTAPGLGEHTLAALDVATDLVLVTGLDVPSIRGLRKELETITELGLPNRHHVVVNGQDRGNGLTVRDVEQTCNTKVDIVLPSSMAVARSINQGIPLLHTASRDRTAKELRRLVSRVAGLPQPAAPKRGKKR